MGKVLHVTMPDGALFAIPAEMIARLRAEYYVDGDIAKGDVDPDGREEAISKETAYALADNSELLDWASNNMDWGDVCVTARLVRPPGREDYHASWPNADKQIVVV